VGEVWQAVVRPQNISRCRPDRHESDGKLLVTAGNEDSVRLWATTDKQLVILKGHKGEVSDAQFSPNNKFIVTVGKDGTACVWGNFGQAVGCPQRHKGKVTDAQFSRMVKYLL
jgi:WD40 repeat protein